MKKLFVSIAVAALCTPALSSAHRLNLIEAYKKAACFDPVIRTAKQNWLASKEAFPQALALQLPTISAAFNTQGNYNEIKTGYTIGATRSPEHFNSHGYSITLRQPLINAANWGSLQQSVHQVRAATARYLEAQQNLIVRTTQAYFNVLLATDIVHFRSQERSAARKYLNDAKKRHKVGLMAETSVHQAKASFDKIRASFIGAQMNLISAQQAFRKITGDADVKLAPLQHYFKLKRPVPFNLNSWKASAREHNLAIVASRHDLYAAQANIHRQIAGHFPTMDLVASVGRNKTNGALAVGNDDFRNDTLSRNLGLQATIPLFQGTNVLSQTRQAQYEYNAAQQTLRGNVINARADVTEFYKNVVKGLLRVRADRHAVLSNQKSLTSTLEAYDVGINNLLDVVSTTRELFSARELLSRDELELIVNSLQLKRAAGTLCWKDVVEMNQWLVNQRATKKA